MKKLIVAIILTLMGITLLGTTTKAPTIDPPETKEMHTVPLPPVIEVIEEPKEEYVSYGEFRVTAYCPCYECSEGWEDKTSTGVRAKEGRTIAVDPNVIPYGTEVLINDNLYVAEDRGGEIDGDEIDIYFKDHEVTDEFGVQYLEVKVRVNR